MGRRLLERGQVFFKLLFEIAQIGPHLKGDTLNAIHPSLQAIHTLFQRVKPLIYPLAKTADAFEDGLYRRLCGEIICHSAINVTPLKRKGQGCAPCPPAD